MMKTLRLCYDGAGAWVLQKQARLRTCCQRMLRRELGQGTTEYAILVGVLVVIAIIAITAFRPKIQELWTAIQDGINGL